MNRLKNKWLWLAIGAVLLTVALVCVLICGNFDASQSTDGDTAPTTTVVSTTTTTVTNTDAAETTTTPSTTAATTTTKAPKTALNITSHKSTSVITDEPFTVFAGTSDPLHPLLLDGVEVKRDKTGAFSVERELTIGKNTFTFTHKDKTVTYTVEYKYVVMRSHSPSGNCRYESGASFSVVVNARAGSTVTATFRGKTITLKTSSAREEDDGKPQSDTFVDYVGSFTLPSDNTSDLSLGKVTFTAAHNGVTSTASSGTIVCKKAVIPVIGEIVAVTAETFDGGKSDDTSRPTNNYLPKGTVDYVVGHSYFEDKEYLNLRCGRRVYVSKKNSPSTQVLQVSKEYAGKLPDTNQLKLADLRITAGATYLTFDTAWKAPFLLDLLPQKYTNPKEQDYTVSSVTCEYVEITFCYANSLTGTFEFRDNHPLFTRATVTKSGKNTVLRLYLRRVGGFYGWDASYNAQGQLEFYFLHPAQVTKADNAYGADLTGVTIMLDVGHGYKSGGTDGLDADHPEGERNYNLAVLLKAELEKMGATVVLNRGAKDDLNAEERLLALKALKPDLCIAIHHDASASSRPHGFGAFHSTLFSVDAARYIYDATIAADIYDTNPKGLRNRFQWHYYFVARMSDCPVVLTENGFMTSPLDHTGIVDQRTNLRKAQAIARGTAQYFLSIRLPYVWPPVTTTTTTTTTTTAITTTTTTAPTTTEPITTETMAETTITPTEAILPTQKEE